MQGQSHYDILGIKKSATLIEIKRAYRKLVLKYHPDKTGKIEHAIRFAHIQKAYETLSDAEKRRRYDYSLRFPSGFRLQKGTPDRENLIIQIEDRTPELDDQIPIRVILKRPVKSFRLRGLGAFDIIEGPLFQAGEFSSKSSAETHVLYLLRPRRSGYLQIGPASVVHKGIEYLSDTVYINVAGDYPAARYRPSTKFEKALYAVVVLFIITYISIVGYNFYHHNIKKKPRVITSVTEDPAPYGTFRSTTNPITGSIPYKQYFGLGVYDDNSFNEIRFRNSRLYDAIVCLASYENDEIVRNNFIESGRNFTMANIPDGIYYLKVFFGNSWDPEKVLNEQRIKGGFEEDVKFEVFNQQANLLYMNHSSDGDTLNYRVYEITLYPVKDGEVKSTNSTQSEFFK